MALPRYPSDTIDATSSGGLCVTIFGHLRSRSVIRLRHRSLCEPESRMKSWRNTPIP